MRTFLISNTILIEKSHVHKSDEMSLKSSFVHQLNRIRRHCECHIVKECCVQVVWNDCCQNNHVDANPISTCFNRGTISLAILVICYRVPSRVKQWVILARLHPLFVGCLRINKKASYKFGAVVNCGFCFTVEEPDCKSCQESPNSWDFSQRDVDQEEENQDWGILHVHQWLFLVFIAEVSAICVLQIFEESVQVFRKTSNAYLLQAIIFKVFDNLLYLCQKRASLKLL